MRILYFTDAHVEPDTDLTRFRKLGKLIVAEKPDVIVQGGDFSSMESLSEWDKDKRRLMEGRRFMADIDATIAAIEELFHPLRVYNERQRENKKPLYRPKIVWLEGNHEYWVKKYVDLHPEVEGMFDLEKSVYDALPCGMTTYVPYKAEDKDCYAVIDGVIFTHAIRNRAGIIGSKYLTDRALAEVYDCNVVFGHTHRLQTSTVTKFGEDGVPRIRRAINGGCFFDTTPRYAIGNVSDYWYGALLLNTNNGSMYVEKEFPMSYIKETY